LLESKFRDTINPASS